MSYSLWWLVSLHPPTLSMHITLPFPSLPSPPLPLPPPSAAAVVTALQCAQALEIISASRTLRADAKTKIVSVHSLKMETHKKISGAIAKCVEDAKAQKVSTYMYTCNQHIIFLPQTGKQVHYAQINLIEERYLVWGSTQLKCQSTNRCYSVAIVDSWKVGKGTSLLVPTPTLINEQ